MHGRTQARVQLADCCSVPIIVSVGSLPHTSRSHQSEISIIAALRCFRPSLHAQLTLDNLLLHISRVLRHSAQERVGTSGLIVGQAGAPSIHSLELESHYVETT